MWVLSCHVFIDLKERSSSKIQPSTSSFLNLLGHLSKADSLSKLTSRTQDAVIKLKNIVFSREVLLLLVKLETKGGGERPVELHRVLLEFDRRSVEDEMREGSAIWTEDTRVRDEGFVGVVGDDGEAREDIDCEGETGGQWGRGKVSFQLFSKSRPIRARIGRVRGVEERRTMVCMPIDVGKKFKKVRSAHERDGRR